MENNPLEDVNIVQRNKDWLEDWDEFMSDPEFQEVLNLAIKIIAKPNVPQPQIAVVCVRLEAYALVMRTRFAEYMGWRKGTTNASAKKNAYKELYQGIDNLVSALKYLVRQ